MTAERYSPQDRPSLHPDTVRIAGVEVRTSADVTSPSDPEDAAYYRTGRGIDGKEELWRVRGTGTMPDGSRVEIVETKHGLDLLLAPKELQGGDDHEDVGSRVEVAPQEGNTAKTRRKLGFGGIVRALGFKRENSDTSGQWQQASVPSLRRIRVIDPDGGPIRYITQIPDELEK